MDSSNVVNEQPQSMDLLGYIGGQQFTAVDADQAVNLGLTETPVETTETQDSASNVDQAVQEVTQAQSLTPAPHETPNADVESLQRELDAERTRNQRQAAAMALLAQNAQKREEALFEKSLELLSPEDQQVERDRREREKIENENTFLRSQIQTRQRAEAQASENADKMAAAGSLMAKLGLPATDPFVQQALMESQTPAEMIAAANRLYTLYARPVAQQAAPAPKSVSVDPVVHRAGGETAPAVAAQRVQQRSGDLIALMGERSYVNASQM